MTTKQEIKEWLQEGNTGENSHMIVVCDTFDYENYPVYVHKSEDIHGKVKEYDHVDMQKVMEVYSYSMDLEEQLDGERAKNY